MIPTRIARPLYQSTVNQEDNPSQDNCLSRITVSSVLSLLPSSLTVLLRDRSTNRERPKTSLSLSVPTHCHCPVPPRPHIGPSASSLPDTQVPQPSQTTTTTRTPDCDNTLHTPYLTRYAQSVLLINPDTPTAPIRLLFATSRRRLTAFHRNPLHRNLVFTRCPESSSTAPTPWNNALPPLALRRPRTFSKIHAQLRPGTSSWPTCLFRLARSQRSTPNSTNPRRNQTPRPNGRPPNLHPPRASSPPSTRPLRMPIMPCYGARTA